jgi:hypothetical protein
MKTSSGQLEGEFGGDFNVGLWRAGLDLFPLKRHFRGGMKGDVERELLAVKNFASMSLWESVA